MPGKEARLARYREAAALLKRAEEAQRRGDLGTAEQLFRHPFADRTVAHRAHLGLARLLEQSGRLTEAVQEYERFFDRSTGVGSSFQHDPCIKVAYARLLERVGQSAKADTVYDAVYTGARPSIREGAGHLPALQRGTTPSDRKAKANVIAGLDVQSYAGRDVDAYFREATRANPSCPEAWFFLGQELADLPGSHDEARQALLRAKALGGQRTDIAESVETTRRGRYYLPGWRREQFYR